MKERLDALHVWFQLSIEAYTVYVIICCHLRLNSPSNTSRRVQNIQNLPPHKCSFTQENSTAHLQQESVQFERT